MESIILGGGCFWCLEALFQRVEGVVMVVPGYAGGFAENPTYEQVCAEKTGHAEVVKIDFNPDKITLEELLDIFWQTHDPTTPNRQGNDVGTQYRSIILYNSESQKVTAEASLYNLSNSELYSTTIVTEIQPLETFFPAEKYHHDYYNRNRNLPYCALVISPKLKKFESLQKKS